MSDLDALARRVARTRASAEAALVELVTAIHQAGGDANVKALAKLAATPRSSIYNHLGRLQDNENTPTKGTA